MNISDKYPDAIPIRPTSHLIKALGFTAAVSNRFIHNASNWNSWYFLTKIHIQTGLTCFTFAIWKDLGRQQEKFTSFFYPKYEFEKFTVSVICFMALCLFTIVFRAGINGEKIMFEKRELTDGEKTTAALILSKLKTSFYSIGFHFQWTQSYLECGDFANCSLRCGDISQTAMHQVELSSFIRFYNQNHAGIIVFVNYFLYIIIFIYLKVLIFTWLFSESLCSPMLLSVFSHNNFIHLALNMYVLYSFTGIVIDKFLGADQVRSFVSSRRFLDFCCFSSGQCIWPQELCLRWPVCVTRPSRGILSGHLEL